MGSRLANNPSYLNNRPDKPLSKGQRLGWVHISEYEPVLLRTLPSSCERLTTYSSGPFSTHKLVP